MTKSESLPPHPSGTSQYKYEEVKGSVAGLCVGEESDMEVKNRVVAGFMVSSFFLVYFLFMWRLMVNPYPQDD